MPDFVRTNSKQRKYQTTFRNYDNQRPSTSNSTNENYHDVYLLIKSPSINCMQMGFAQNKWKLNFSDLSFIRKHLMVYLQKNIRFYLRNVIHYLHFSKVTM